jgi:hypothetical protein
MPPLRSMEALTRRAQEALHALLSRRNSRVGKGSHMRNLPSYLKTTASDSNRRKKKY